MPQVEPTVHHIIARVFIHAGVVDKINGQGVCPIFVSEQDWRTLQAYADNVDDAFQRQYGLAPTTQRYMSKWALTEVLGLMHRYLQVCGRS